MVVSQITDLHATMAADRIRDATFELTAIKVSDSKTRFAPLWRPSLAVTATWPSTLEGTRFHEPIELAHPHARGVGAALHRRTPARGGCAGAST
jgi:hypothetical protein